MDLARSGFAVPLKIFKPLGAATLVISVSLVSINLKFQRQAHKSEELVSMGYSHVSFLKKSLM